LSLTGDNETAIRDLRQAVDIATHLVQVDPKQTDFQFKLAAYATQLSRLKRLTGDLLAAQALTTQSLGILSALVKQDPANAAWKQYLAEAQIEQAAQSMAANHRDVARSLAKTALGYLDPLFAEQPDDRSLLLDTVTAKLLLADASDDASTGRRLRNGALQALDAVKAGQRDPRLLALQAKALLTLDRKTDAQPLLKQLWNEGYRDPALLAVLRHEHINYPLNTELSQRIVATQASATNHPHPASGTRLSSPGASGRP
jgi:predicted Zn-dependent protease